MLKIRLQRVGRINSAAYRVIVAEHTRGPKTGNFVEIVGTYDPRTKARSLKEDRIKYWLSVGAQPSATMHNMLISAGVMSGKKINVLPAFKAPAAAEAPVSEPVAAAETSSEASTEAAPETPAEVEAAPVDAPAATEAPADEQ